ncbi:ferrochelatase [Elysia marginata]|uniref:Ferrochelatase n=1 Tax=Elysia marginata TaxID=1093978 RepID=A0AAV4ELT5_9GAST|nr:ferrochelatase [Elysia marginata]
MDERVIDVPYWLRVFIVRGIILNTRPKKSAHAYKTIWWDEGSPLIVLTKRLREKVQKYLDIPVEIGMRYGSPSIKSGLQALCEKGVKEVIMLPLYPQFAMATTETVNVLAEKVVRNFFPDMTLKHIPAFYNRRDYIEVLSGSIKAFLKGKNYDYLLFSYHGVPERHIKKRDITKSHCKLDECCQKANPAHEFCYRHQCYATTQSVVKKLNLKDALFQTSFQSRLGVDPWLQPYTDQTIANLPQKGVKNLAVVMPAFVSDCLETLEEIGKEARVSFLENGGESFHLVPCLNDRDDWAKTVASWAKE